MTAPYAPRHARPANPPGEAGALQWRGRPAGSGVLPDAPDPGGYAEPCRPWCQICPEASEGSWRDGFSAWDRCVAAGHCMLNEATPENPESWVWQ